MQLNDLGIKLKKLTNTDLELVRKWRNLPEVKQYMFFQDDISEEMQKQWFERISTPEHYFFLIHDRKNEKIGMIEIKNIEKPKSSGEFGIFVVPSLNKDPTVSLCASLITLNFAFQTLNLDKVHGQVRSDNNTAIKYNQQLGFERKDFSSDKIYFELSKAQHVEHNTRLYEFYKKRTI